MKNRYFLVFAVVLLLATSALVVAKPSWKDPQPADCPITDTTDFAYYGETGRGGVGDLSESWLNHFLSWWQTQDPTIEYVELDDGHVKGDCDLDSYPNLKLYIQPGGNAYYQQRTLGSDGKANILSYINSGKAYLGICAGAYYAAGDYFWQGSYYDWSNLLGVYPTLEGSITDIADYDENPGYALTPLASGHNMIYYGGPTRGWRDTSSVFPGYALNTFNALPGDIPAAIRDDNLLLMSVHAEAYENDGISGLSSADRLENYIWFANQINDVAGTNFYVPSSQLPVCGNGVIESGEECDGNDLGSASCIDFGYDAGGLSCSSDCTYDVSFCEYNVTSSCGDLVCDANEDYLSCPSDCSAPEPFCGDLVCDVGEDYVSCPSDCSAPEPTVLFNDGFESGTLLSWDVYGLGNPWVASSYDPAVGTYSAMSQQSGAGNPTYMQVNVNASAGTIVAYDRKLVGLDAADDFEVAYMNAFGEWIVLEHVSSTTDSGYVHKSFVVPEFFYLLRFMCETGAVSEYCFVDNVVVEAQ